MVQSKISCIPAQNIVSSQQINHRKTFASSKGSTPWHLHYPTSGSSIIRATGSSGCSLHALATPALLKRVEVVEEKIKNVSRWWWCTWSDSELQELMQPLHALVWRRRRRRRRRRQESGRQGWPLSLHQPARRAHAESERLSI